MGEIPDFVEPKRKAYIIPSKALDILGGTYISFVKDNGETMCMVDKGACLFGVDNLEAGKGIFNHSLLVARKAYIMAKALKEESLKKNDGKYADLDENMVAMLGVFHDVVKLHSGSNPKPKGNTQWVASRENLTTEEKQKIGLPGDYREISPEADNIAVGWIEQAGLPDSFVNEFKQVVVGHDFPQSDEAIYTTTQKLIQVADYSVGQDFSMTVHSRWLDVADRWVKPYVINWNTFTGDDTLDIIEKHNQEFQYDESKPPRIEADRLANAVRVVEKAASEVFSYLGISEEEFAREYKPEGTIPPWEKALRKAWERDYTHQKQGEIGTPSADRLKRILREHQI